MGKDYHDRLVMLIANSHLYLEKVLDFKPEKIFTNYHINNGSSDNFEVDILVMGEKNKSVIEVKSNSKLRGKYYIYQLERFRSYFPSASNHLVYSSRDGSLLLEDLVWEHIEDLRGKPEYL